MIRLYTLAIWIGPRATKVGLIDSFWNKRCPSYKELCQEDIAYILLEYKKFANSIHKYITPLKEWLIEQRSTLQREELATLILSGQVNGVSSKQQWLGETTYNKANREAPFIKVTRFLQAIMPQ